MIDLPAKSKNRILQIMSARAGQSLGAAENSILDALLNREKFGSTGVGEGIAIPHTRVPGVNAPFGMLARLNPAIDFDAIDDAPVDLVFLLLMPGDGDKDNLNVLACVARRLRSPETVRNIRNAASVDEVYAAMLDEAPHSEASPANRT